jgi:hypothetical protein
LKTELSPAVLEWSALKLTIEALSGMPLSSQMLLPRRR